MLLARLFRFRFSNVGIRFDLAGLIHYSETRAVRVAFIAGFRLRAIRFRNKGFRLRQWVARVHVVVRFRLLWLVAFRLFFVRWFLMFNFHALRVGFRGQHACVRAISSLAMGFRSADVGE